MQVHRRFFCRHKLNKLHNSSTDRRAKRQMAVYSTRLVVKIVTPLQFYDRNHGRYILRRRCYIQLLWLR